MRRYVALAGIYRCGVEAFDRTFAAFGTESKAFEFRIGGQSKIDLIAASVSQGPIDMPTLIVLTQHQRGPAVSLEKGPQVNNLNIPDRPELYTY